MWEEWHALLFSLADAAKQVMLIVLQLACSSVCERERWMNMPSFFLPSQYKWF